MASTTAASMLGTHSGAFHTDEVFACYMLKKLPKFQNHVVVRTRDQAILDTCEVVVDVGGVYDHGKKRYDHHQPGFTETMNTILGMEFHTKLSSAGLVYAHYGKEVIAQILKLDANNASVNVIFDKLYRTFVESVDAIDNGIQQFDGEPKYMLSSTLNSRIGSLNPAWNDKESRPDEQFSKAMKVIAEEFEDRLKYLHNSWIPARELVLKAIQKRKEVHPSGKILSFESTGIPWKDHFFTMEKELGLAGEDISMTIYRDGSDPAGSWRLQAIPVSETSGFENRVAIPWRGCRDADLEKESGIPGAKFVHMSGFIGGAKTREGVLAMAVETLRSSGKL